MFKGKRFGSHKKRDYSGSEEKKAKLGILSEDVMSYYRNVSASLESGFDEDSSLKDDFLTNVYTTLKDEGIQVSQNQTVSRILEMLFSHSEPHHMQELFCSFCGELTIVTFDRFASHVFQSLIHYLPAIYEQDQENGSKQTKQPGKLHASVTQLCKFMESHMRDVMTHTYASHVLRSLLEALGGVEVKEEVVRSRMSRTQRKDNNEASHSGRTLGKTLARDFQASFETLKDKVLYLCNYEDHLSDPNYCPVLQTVLLILHKTSPKGYKELVSTIVEKTCILPESVEVDADDVTKRLPDIVQNEVGSYLIELLISLASETQLRQLYDQIFKGKLIYFAVHSIANYVLQKLLSTVTDSQMMDELLSDISQYVEDILAVNHIGIITKLAEACRRTGFGQERFLKALLTAFHCQEPDSHQVKLVPLVASLQTYEVFFHVQDSNADAERKNESSSNLLRTTNIHGSLLLQQLLQFTQPKLVVSSLLNLTPVELVGLCCDKCGSHVVDCFFQSQTVLEKHKHGFLKKLEGMFVNIGCNRNGSRCLESIWKGSSLKQRIMMAEELSKSQERLEGDQWGRFLYRNFALFKFSQRRKEWMEIQGSSTKRQQLLQDILQGKASKKKHKKTLKTAEQEGQDQDIQSSSEGDDSKKRKAPEESTEFETSVQKKEKHPTEGKAPKKKAKLETEPSVPDSGSAAPDRENISFTKKRKRNKEKKRVVRNAEIQEPMKTQEFSSEPSAADKVKKKRKDEKTDGERTDKTKVDRKGKKKNKARTEGVEIENFKPTEPVLKPSKPHKEKKHKFEKKGKFKKMKIKH